MLFSILPGSVLAHSPSLFINQGEVLFYPIQHQGNLSATFGGTKIPVFESGGKNYALVAVDVRKNPGIYNLRIRNASKELEKKAVRVTKGDYVEVVRGVPYKFATLSKGEQASVADEKKELIARLNAAIKKPSPRFWQNIQNPLEQMTVTSPYGYKRIYTNHSTVHHGADLRAKIGTPVYAISEGKVIWGESKPLYLEGPMVAIDHGDGIVSKYLHLSKVVVRSDTMVKAGDLIGYSGDEGADVSGAHLHFGIKIGNASVNPLQFITAAQEISSN